MLLSGRCEILGLKEAETLSFAVRGTEMKLISVVGSPEKGAIKEAVSRNENRGVMITPLESSRHVAEALPDWTGGPAVIHLLGNAPRLPEIPKGVVRLLAPLDLAALAHLPADLLAELVLASQRSLIAATFVDGGPVSFCYVVAETESLWDISIDTLAEYRGRGYAALCVAYLIGLMRERGKQPVWGAEESNPPSLRLAAKLGFVPVDRLLVFQPTPGD
jgi:GNAT superfamily N-acetyltransferase